MRALWRWLKRLLVVAAVLILGLLAPPAYIELACRGDAQPDSYASLISDPEWRRPESRTLLTYPEWHIVHAYDDYGRVLATGDPHDFAYVRAIAGFWGTLCPLTEAADAMGEITTDTKLTIYTIGVSLTAELLAKAAYEETIGRVATWLRDGERSPLDDVSAKMAANYAVFLQQVPWYKWDFAADVEQLESEATGSFRDRERLFALRNEFLAKAWYAKQIEAAVAGLGADALRIRSIVQNISGDDLSSIPGVTVIGPMGDGTLIETDRYRAFTDIIADLAANGADFAEIAGNNDILFTVISPTPEFDGALYSFLRQGYGDYRHLVLIPVAGLAGRLRTLDDVSLEHVHDY